MPEVVTLAEGTHEPVDQHLAFKLLIDLEIEFFGHKLGLDYPLLDGRAVKGQTGDLAQDVAVNHPHVPAAAAPPPALLCAIAITFPLIVAEKFTVLVMSTVAYHLHDDCVECDRPL